MSQARCAWLLFVLAPVFDLHVRLASGGRQARLPGVPGSAPAPTAPGWSSSRVLTPPQEAPLSGSPASLIGGRQRLRQAEDLVAAPA